MSIAEKQLSTLAKTFSLVNDCVYVTDTNDEVVFVNDAFCKTYGYDTDEILGKKSTVLFEDSEKFSLEEVLNLEQVHSRKNDCSFPVSISKSVLTNDDGEPSAIVVISRDISKQKHVEQELQEVKEKLELMNKELLSSNKYLQETTTMAKELASQAEIASSAKTDFLANMSHEIRTPLNAIIGMIDLVLGTDLESEQREYLEIAHSSSEGLLSLINEILDFSKIEAGGMVLEETAFTLREVVEECIDIFGYRAQLKGLELIGYVQPEIPDNLIGDPVRVRQVIINLIGNAIKFTKKGEIVVRLEAVNETESDEECSIQFSVSDTGVGISEAQIKRIFHKFSQADNSTTRKYGGTGLGLNIAKSLINLMGGELEVESEENKGSVFKFISTFPVDKANDSKPDSLPCDGGFINVLLVNSSETNRKLLTNYLNFWGLKVTEATENIEVNSFLCEADFSKDLIIVDYELHDMVEKVITSYLEGNASKQEITTIVVVPYKTAWKQSKRQKVTGFLNKPIKQSKLRNVLKSVLDSSIENKYAFMSENVTVVEEESNADSREKQKIISNRVDEKVPERAHILLAEDNPDNQLLFTKILENTGYGLDIASNGRDAINLAKESDYDLILMDIYMPQVDGFGATKKIRAFQEAENKERIPIVALTAHAIDGYKEKCIKGGMDDYITKPVRKKTLLAKIDEWVIKSKEGKPA